MLKVEFEDLGTGLELIGQQEEYAISDILDIKLEEVASFDGNTLTNFQTSSYKRLKELQKELDVLIEKIGHNVVQLRATRTDADAKGINKALKRKQNSSKKGLNDLQNEMDSLLIRIGENIAKSKSERLVAA